MIDAERFPVHEIQNEGTLDDLIEYTLRTVPASHKKAFREAFCRESLLQAFREGKNTVTMEFPQRNKNGKQRTMETNAMMMEDSGSGDILEIALSRYLD